MKLTVEQFLEKAWKGYLELTPDAPVIHGLLRARGDRIRNDHIALRTFDLPGIDVASLGLLFERWGYRMADEQLDFPEKKLRANYWLPPSEELPKVFISELILDKVSPELAGWIRGLIPLESLARRANEIEFLLDPVPGWGELRFEDYERFLGESEYAAWTAAFGVRVNHFTVFVNSLGSFASLAELVGFLRGQGLRLNESGGVIKGTPAECLEQASTMARQVPWRFQGGRIEPIQGCYYEFAQRHIVPGTSRLFEGFIPKSADRIFESTSAKLGE